MQKLSINANLRYFDVNDRTPVAQYSNAGGGIYNTPQSYTTTSGKLEATYRLPAGFNVTGGIDYSDQDRSFPKIGTVYVPYRSDIRETTYRLQLRRSLADDLNGTIAYMLSDRDGSAYKPANGGGSTFPNNNQINPINTADRLRSKWRAALDWEPIEKASVQFRADYSQDTYSHDGRPYGLTDGTNQVYAVDGSYAFNDNWSLSAWYSYDVTKANEAGGRQGSAATTTIATRTGSQQMADANKYSRLKDVGDSAGMNLRGKVSARWEISAAADWFRSTSSYDQQLQLLGPGTAYLTALAAAGGAPQVVPLDDIKNNLLRLKLDGKYALDKSSDILFSFVHERWHTDDWSWQFADGSPFAYYNGGTPNSGNTLACPAACGNVRDGTTVKAKDTQTSNFFGVRYTYKFQ
jgi:hypothetical protein